MQVLEENLVIVLSCTEQLGYPQMLVDKKSTAGGVMELVDMLDLGSSALA